MSVSSGSDVTIPIQDSPPPPPSPYANRNVGRGGKSTPEPRGDITGIENKGYQQESETKRGKNGSPKGNDKKGHSEINMISNGEKGDLNEAVNSELINMNIMNTIPAKPQSEFGPYEQMDDYFIPVNQHKKFLRSEKLYVTKDKRKGSNCKKYVCWAFGAFCLAAVVAIAVLAGVGVIPQKTSELNVDQIVGETTPSPISTTSRIMEVISSTAAPSLRPLDNYVPNTAEVGFYITNARFEAALNNKSSERFLEMSKDIQSLMETLLIEQAGLHNVTTRIDKFEPGSIIVKMFIGWADENMELRTVQSALSNVTSLGNYEIRAITFYDVANQCKFNKSFNCSHYCVYDVESLEFLCTCPETMRLAEDTLTCQDPSTMPVQPEPEPEISSSVKPEEVLPSSSEPSSEPETLPETENSTSEPEPEPETVPEEVPVEASSSPIPDPVSTSTTTGSPRSEEVVPESNEHENPEKEPDTTLSPSGDDESHTEVSAQPPLESDSVVESHNQPSSTSTTTIAYAEHFPTASSAEVIRSPEEKHTHENTQEASASAEHNTAHETSQDQLPSAEVAETTVQPPIDVIEEHQDQLEHQQHNVNHADPSVASLSSTSTTTTPQSSEDLVHGVETGPEQSQLEVLIPISSTTTVGTSTTASTTPILTSTTESSPAAPSRESHELPLPPISSNESASREASSSSQESQERPVEDDPAPVLPTPAASSNEEVTTTGNLPDAADAASSVERTARQQTFGGELGLLVDSGEQGITQSPTPVASSPRPGGRYSAEIMEYSDNNQQRISPIVENLFGPRGLRSGESDSVDSASDETASQRGPSGESQSASREEVTTFPTVSLEHDIDVNDQESVTVDTVQSENVANQTVVLAHGPSEAVVISEETEELPSRDHVDSVTEDSPVLHEGVTEMGRVDEEEVLTSTTTAPHHSSNHSSEVSTPSTSSQRPEATTKILSAPDSAEGSLESGLNSQDNNSSNTNESENENELS